jgi:hypothetical protein
MLKHGVSSKACKTFQRPVLICRTHTFTCHLNAVFVFYAFWKTNVPFMATCRSDKLNLFWLCSSGFWRRVDPSVEANVPQKLPLLLQGLRGDAGRWRNLYMYIFIFIATWALKMEPICFSEAFSPTDQSTWPQTQKLIIIIIVVVTITTAVKISVYFSKLFINVTFIRRRSLIGTWFVQSTFPSPFTPGSIDRFKKVVQQMLTKSYCFRMGLTCL